jgi:uncharacterized protein (TIGR02679 family)
MEPLGRPTGRPCGEQPRGGQPGGEQTGDERPSGGRLQVPLGDAVPDLPRVPAAAGEDRLRRVLGGNELSWLVDRVRARIARGAPLDGVVALSGATTAQRQAAGRLLGRPAGHGSSLSVSLPAIELALREAGLAADLRSAVETLTGAVPDAVAERARFAQRRDMALQAAATCRHAAQEWFAAWLAELSGDGTLTRLLRAGRDDALAQAAAVLDRLPATDLPLPVLAERATGDTKALSGPPLPGLVLHALARREGTAPPATRAGRRALWEAAGVIVDDLASQVLVLNVPASGAALGRWLTESAVLGVPFRVTLHQLATMPVTLDPGGLRVCENPAVLRAAAADLGPRCEPLVCTEGIPSAACHRLLSQASVLHWRADFDWTGLRVVGAAIERYGAVPWRMGAGDYLDAAAAGESETLKGPSAASPWDARLAAEMRASGRAVMEERLIPLLLRDLDRGAAGQFAR